MPVHTPPANPSDPQGVDRGTHPRSEPPPVDTGREEDPTLVRRTRISATWGGIVVGAAVLVLLIVFMLQNTVPVEVSFLGLHGSAPLALALLIAGLGFAVVTLVVGSLRIGQLRRRIRRGAPPQRAEHDPRS